MANKKRFYGDAVVAGASAISLPMPIVPGSGYNVLATGIPVRMIDISAGQVNAGEAGTLLPSCDAARVSSVIVPAGMHAIINFEDGREFVCHCADKPVKVKPSMLAPAHAWRAMNDSDVLFRYLLCDANGQPLIGSATSTLTTLGLMGKSLQVNVAVRTV